MNKYGIMFGAIPIMVETTSSDLVIIAETTQGTTVVKKTNGLMNVLVNGVTKHPNCTSDDVIRALVHYLESMEYRVKKLTDEKEQMVIDHRGELLDLASRHSD